MVPWRHGILLAALRRQAPSKAYDGSGTVALGFERREGA